MNNAPELFHAVVAEVPFVDVLTTMLDDSLPLTVGEWEEWGNPDASATSYRTMKGYSPYDNVHDGTAYPHLYASGGLNDSRVGFWEPAKVGAPPARRQSRNPGRLEGLKWEPGTADRPVVTTLGTTRHKSSRGFSTKLRRTRRSRSAKHRINVGGSGEGKFTATPSTATVALDGEPIVICEPPVILSDFVAPWATVP